MGFPTVDGSMSTTASISDYPELYALVPHTWETLQARLNICEVTWPDTPRHISIATALSAQTRLQEEAVSAWQTVTKVTVASGTKILPDTLLEQVRQSLNATAMISLADRQGGPQWTTDTLNVGCLTKEERLAIGREPQNDTTLPVRRGFHDTHVDPPQTPPEILALSLHPTVPTPKPASSAMPPPPPPQAHPQGRQQSPVEEV